MTTNLSSSTHGVEHALDDLLGARPMRNVWRFGFEQLRMRQHDAELIIQLVKEQTELWIRDWSVHSGLACRTRRQLGRGARRCRVRHVRGRRRRIRARVRVPPERVGEDANRTTRGPHVLHFASGDPVIDGAPADANRFARLHD